MNALHLPRTRAKGVVPPPVGCPLRNGWPLHHQSGVRSCSPDTPMTKGATSLSPLDAPIEQGRAFALPCTPIDQPPRGWVASGDTLRFPGAPSSKGFRAPAPTVHPFGFWKRRNTDIFLGDA